MRWTYFLLLALAGCARSTIGDFEDDAGATGGLNGGGSTGGSTAGMNGGMNGGMSGATNGSTTGGTTGGSTTGGTGGTTGGASGATGGGTTGAMMCPTATTSCAAPTDLGMMVGNVDTKPPLMQTGSGSAWFKLTVVDDDSNGFVESMMGLVAKLTAGAEDYDIYVYKNGDTACNQAPFMSVNATGTEYIDHVWGTGGPTAEDPRTLIVEVRQIGTACGNWTLTLEGHPCSHTLVFSGETCAEAGRKPLHQ